MLKGINIGGENRLKYLDFLRNKQDENLDNLIICIYWKVIKIKKKIMY